MITHLELIKAEEVCFSSNIPGNGANGVVGMGLLSPRGLRKRLLELMNPWEGEVEAKVFSRDFPSALRPNVAIAWVQLVPRLLPLTAMEKNRFSPRL